MRGADRSRLTVVAAAAWLAFAAMAVSHRTSEAVPSPAVTVAAVVALGLALAAGGRTTASMWRGPAIRPFSHDDAVCCGPGEAAIVRAAAQLRGTLGGAGHVRRGRLAISALAWLAAAGAAGSILAEAPAEAALLWGGATAALSGAAGLLPAQPFYYREAMGGWILVHPRHACERLVTPGPAAEHARPAVPASASPVLALDATEGDGWGTSLTSAQTGSNRAPPPGEPLA